MDEELKSLKDKIESEQTLTETDSDGRIVVSLKVDNDDGFLSPYCVGNSVDIAPDAADFIERAVIACEDGKLGKKKLKLRVFSDVIDENEKPVYEKAIREHYVQAYKQSKQSVNKHNRLAIVFGAIAVLVLAVMIVLDIAGVINALTSEILDIVAWVFMWEAVYILLLQRPAEKIKELRYLKIAEAVIEFVPLGKV